MSGAFFMPGERCGYALVLKRTSEWIGWDHTTYTVQFDCCGIEVEMSHRELGRLAKKNPESCRKCFVRQPPKQAGRASDDSTLFRAVRRATIAQPKGGGVWVGREWWPSIQGPMGPRHGMTGRY